MTKKILIFSALLLLIGAFAFAEIELGIGIAPPLTTDEEDTNSDPSEHISYSLHVGYSFWWLFYASWDAYVMPASLISALTGTTDQDENFIPGIYKPGVMNMIDFGIRPRIGPLLFLTELGVNSLYVYDQQEDEQSELGGNVRIGAGIRLGHLSIMATVSSVFSSFENMAQTFEDLGSGNPRLEEKAQEKLTETLLPTITLNLWF
jgi:hypothetical protein